MDKETDRQLTRELEHLQRQISVGQQKIIARMDAQSLVTKFLDLTRRPKWSVEKSAAMVKTAKQRKQKELEEQQQESSKFSSIFAQTNRSGNFMRAAKFAHRRARSLDRLFVSGVTGIGGPGNSGSQEISEFPTSRSVAGPKGRLPEASASLTDRGRLSHQRYRESGDGTPRRVVLPRKGSPTNQQQFALKLQVATPALKQLVNALQIRPHTPGQPGFDLNIQPTKNLGDFTRKGIQHNNQSSWSQESRSCLPEEPEVCHPASRVSLLSHSYLAMRTSVQKAYISHRRVISESIFAQTGISVTEDRRQSPQASQLSPDALHHRRLSRSDHPGAIPHNNSMVPTPNNLQPLVLHRNTSKHTAHQSQIGADPQESPQMSTVTQNPTKNSSTLPGITSPRPGYLSLKQHWRIPQPLFDRGVRIKL